MNLEEALKLPAGSKLNALVSQCSGWQAWQEKRGDYDLAVCCGPDEKRPWEHYRFDSRGEHKKRYREIDCLEALKVGFYGEGFPAFSTDIAAAWKLVDKDHPCGWFDSFALIRYGAGYAIMKIRRPHEVVAEADTAPLAICRAAIQALWKANKE